MERNVLPRRRGQDGPARPARPPARVMRDRRHQQTASQQQEKPQTEAFPSKIRTQQGSDGNNTVSDQLPAPGRPSEDDARHPKHFTVSNVGTGGRVYLKPTQNGGQHMLRTSPRTQLPNVAARPGTRPDWSQDYSLGNPTSTLRPHGERPRSASIGSGQGTPTQLSLRTNKRPQARARSHSFSTVNEHIRASMSKPNDVPLPLQENRRLPRPKSSADLPSGLLLDLQIPHYRLGTPRFSAHGTAYLHNSMYSSSSSGMHSSVLAGGDYEKLFPEPPSGAAPNRFSRRSSMVPSYLHPSTAYLARRTGRRTMLSSRRPLRSETISPAIFHWLEQNLHDPTVVQYHPSTGRVFAATPARLIALITSPQFLDYELLADFFLTFRCFMPCQDVLEYLLARMQWAFDSTAEAGRIVRVRTFVALRHWILNYFADDFVSDWSLRNRFCDLVNGLANSVQQRPNNGGSDLNILGELKKCWRRTCALFWPAPDALDTSANVDIIPGGEQTAPPAMDSVVSLPLTIRPTTRSTSIFEMTKLPAPTDRNSIISSTTDGRSTMASSHPRVQMVRFNSASIPASPMSEESLDVLSCSVPFLRHLRPSHHTRQKSSSSSQYPPLSGKSSMKSGHRHKRSGSFSDALRDNRNQTRASELESIDLNDLPDFTFTGGLVRGILLQPSPASLYPPNPKSQESNVEAVGVHFARDTSSERQYRNPGVKRIVGDVRRALSSRHKHSESPVRTSRSASSSELPTSGTTNSPELSQPLPPKPTREVSKLDILAAVIEHSYQTAFQTIQDYEGPLPEAPEAPFPEAPDAPLPEAPEAPFSARDRPPSHLDVRFGRGRGESHITTGSRSILIFDDTGGPESPMLGDLHLQRRSKSYVSSQPSPRGSDNVNAIPVNHGIDGDFVKRQSSWRNGSGKYQWQSFDERFHDFLTAPRSWKGHERGSSADGRIQSHVPNARKSSSVQPEGFELHPIQHQLRRRPGGDLKTAVHVHELENFARSHHSIGTFSSIYPSRKPSTMHSRNISDMPHWHRQGSMPRSQQSRAVSGTAPFALLESHPDEANLRPSFAAQLTHLKGLPDRDSHMGIEDALMKLEGKIPSPSKSTFSSTEHDSGADLSGLQKRGLPAELRNLATLSAQAGRFSPDGPSPTLTETQGASIFYVSDSGDVSLNSRTGLPLTSPATASSSSIIPMTSRISRLPFVDVEAMSPHSRAHAPKDQPNHHRSSVQPNQATPDDEKPPKSSQSHRSFYLNDNESLSDISTEIADPDDFGFRTFFFDDSTEDATAPVNPFLIPPIIPQTYGFENGNSPTVRVTSPSVTRLVDSSGGDVPLSPGAGVARNRQTQVQGYPVENRRDTQIPAGLNPAVHMPFVLAFDSDVIAEQLTIIEKDALDEVDWKDLIGLNWQQNPYHIRNWVEYLQRENSNGIDILIARFNLVVKWVISEVILINNTRERARAITKFIHIAEQSHQLHNYASLYQITLALLSSDLAVLRKTWALVGAREKQRLAKLEVLCQPLRNFHNLRAEMETTSPDVGCIPFIGLYTHDLMLNAQRPARVMPPIPVAQPLVNFERFQIAAAIVKSLLRLIEASAKYVFRPHPEVLSRCLWIAALEDYEIAARCAELERS